jgi:hypothetical protein
LPVIAEEAALGALQDRLEKKAPPFPMLHDAGLIIVPATQGHSFQPGKNSLSLKQLAGLTKTPLRDLHFIWGWPKR